MIVLYYEGGLCLSEDRAPGKTGTFFCPEKGCPDAHIGEGGQETPKTRAGDFKYS
jgi:hypothetical protein